MHYWLMRIRFNWDLTLQLWLKQFICLHFCSTVWGAYCCFKLQVINIRLTPDYKYWGLDSISFLSLYFTHTQTHAHISYRSMDLDCPQMEPEWNTQTQHIFFFSQKHTDRHKHQMTCIYVKELALLLFLLLLLFCLLPGQLGLLDPFFRLLPFLVILYCLLKRNRQNNSWFLKQILGRKNGLYIILN